MIRLARGSVATSSWLVRVWAGFDGPAHHLINPNTGVSAVTPTVTSTIIAVPAPGPKLWPSWRFCATPIGYWIGCPVSAPPD